MRQKLPTSKIILLALFASAFLISLVANSSRLDPFGFGNIPMGPEPLFKYDSASILKALRVIEVDPDCGTQFNLKTLYPSFTGDYNKPLMTSVEPPIREDVPGIVSPHFINGQARYPGDTDCYTLGETGCWKKALHFDRIVDGVSFETTAFRSYCHKQHATSLRQIFASGFDVPADFISLWSENYIRSKWQKEMPELRLKYPNNDVETFYELNLKAARIWQKIKFCQGSDEQARAAVYSAEFACAELKPELSDYFASVQSYFQTSFFKAPSVKFKSEAEIGFAIASGKSWVEKVIDPLPAQHPLFTQACLQVLATVVPIDRDVSFQTLSKELSEGKNGIDHRLYVGIGQLFHFMPNPSHNHIGLWPSANRAVYNAYQHRSMRLVADVVRGLEITWAGAIATGTTNARLPDIYSAKFYEIAIETKKIGARYNP